MKRYQIRLQGPRGFFVPGGGTVPQSQLLFALRQEGIAATWPVPERGTAERADGTRVLWFPLKTRNPITGRRRRPSITRPVLKALERAMVLAEQHAIGQTYEPPSGGAHGDRAKVRRARAWVDDTIAWHEE